jgi:hypothetical protein
MKHIVGIQRASEMRFAGLLPAALRDGEPRW